MKLKDKLLKRKRIKQPQALPLMIYGRDNDLISQPTLDSLDDDLSDEIRDLRCTAS